MTQTTPNVEYARAALGWALDERVEEMRRCIGKLSREQVLDTLRACGDLARELQQRHSELAEQELAAYEAEMVARAVLTPDALPDKIVGRTG